MANKWMRQMMALEGAVDRSYNPFAHIIQSPSPSVNYIFGKTHGIPEGYSVVLFGPPKSGKTVLCNMLIGELHKNDPEAWVVKFNTEMREEGQMTPEEEAKLFGIDPERYICYGVNTPDMIFDRIENELLPKLQDGMPIKMIIIDSMNGIQGRRAMNTDTVMTQNIGDEALTIQTGLKRILPIQRKFHIALIMTTHIRAEMDMGEQMRGNKFRMAASFGVQHHAEYFVWIEKDRSKEGKEDLLGQKFLDENKQDALGNEEKTAVKIKVQMKANSLGAEGRAGKFTFDFKRGIVNTHEEVFLLGVNRQIIQKPTIKTYTYGDREWVGKPAILAALKDDPALCSKIITELRNSDMDGTLKEEVAVEESA